VTFAGTVTIAATIGTNEHRRGEMRRWIAPPSSLVALPMRADEHCDAKKKPGGRGVAPRRCEMAAPNASWQAAAIGGGDRGRSASCRA
jgi:hypothetical protein